MINKFKYSLNFKIFVITTALLFIVSFISYHFIYITLPNAYVQQADQTTKKETKQLLKELESTTWEESINIIHRFEKLTNAQVYIIDSEGRLIKFSKDIDIGYRIVIPVKENITNFPIDITFDNASSSSFQETTSELLLEYDFKFLNNEKTYQLLIQANAIPVNQLVLVFQKILPWNIVIILFVSLTSSYVYSRYITKPILSIGKVAKRIAGLDFEARCKSKRKDELGILTESINEMSDNLATALTKLKLSNLKLQNDIEKERRLEEQRTLLFSSISHELKTPITILQGQLDSMLHNVGEYSNRDKYLKRSLEITKSMENTVREIIMLSRMEQHGFTPNKHLFDLAEVLRQIIITYIDLMEEKNLNLEIDLPKNLTILADKLLIEKALGNIISNAVFYTPKGETIKIRLWEDTKSTHILISNDGVTIPETDIPHIFESFYRVDTSRNKQTGGTGLGLYFVAKIFKEHNFLYNIENKDHGVEFTITINNSLELNC